MASLSLFPAWVWLVVAAFGFSCMNWIAVAKYEKRFEWVFKPLTIVCLILAALLMKSGYYHAYMRSWFLLALFFSLCGDVFLLFSSNRMFLLGLTSFLTAHVCYIVGLNANLPPVTVWGIAVVLVILYAFIYPEIDRALRHKGYHELRIPSAVYAVILSLMLGSTWAVLLRPAWPFMSKLTIWFGGSLFYLSDLQLAWNKFVNHTHRRDVLVMVTYQMAQIFLTASIGLS